MKSELYIPRQVIADCSMVSKDVVHKAIKSGRLDENSLLSVVCFVMSNRLTAGGVASVTGVSPDHLERVENFPRTVPKAIKDMDIEELIAGGYIGAGENIG